MNLVHFIKDDKFTDCVFKEFENIDDVNNLFICLEKKPEPNSFLTKLSQKITFLNQNESNKLDSILDKADFAIIHALNIPHIKLINSHPKTVYIWIGMGFDYYDLLVNDLYYKYSKEKTSLIKPIKIRIRDKIEEKQKVSAINNITYFVPVLEAEYKDLIKTFPHLYFIEWHYGASAKLLSENHFLNNDANSLLLGNSADPTNNHFEVLEVLDQIKYRGKIYIPLSYGDMKYKNSLLEDAKIFNLDILPLTEYMTKENYFNLLKNCDIVVMNHLRQQGAGNINCMLSMGAKVFLNSTSPLYEFYLNQGANVFDTKKIDLEMLSKPLSSEQRIQNKKVINMHFSSTAISKKTRRFLSLLKSTISSNF